LVFHSSTIAMMHGPINIRLMKILSVGAELFHADGRTKTDGRKDGYDDATSCFSQFCEHA